MLKKWSEGEFKGDPQLNLIPSLYNHLRREGVDFSTSDQVRVFLKQSFTLIGRSLTLHVILANGPSMVKLLALYLDSEHIDASKHLHAHSKIKG